jgi:hypothetical protein
MLRIVALVYIYITCMLSVGVHYTGPKLRPWLDLEPRHPAQPHQHQLALFKPLLPLPRVSQPSRRSYPFKPPQKLSHRVLPPPPISRALTSPSWHRGAKDTEPLPRVLPPPPISRASMSSPPRWCRRHPMTRAHPPPTTRPSCLRSLFACAAAQRDPDQPTEAAPEAAVPVVEDESSSHTPPPLRLRLLRCGVRGPGAAMPEAENYVNKKIDSICDGVCGEVSHSAPLPHPHSLACPCQICPACRRGVFLSVPRCLIAVDA